MRVAEWASIFFEKPEILKHLGKSYVVEPVHFQGTPMMIVALANGQRRSTCERLEWTSGRLERERGDTMRLL